MEGKINKTPTKRARDMEEEIVIKQYPKNRKYYVTRDGIILRVVKQGKRPTSRGATVFLSSEGKKKVRVVADLVWETYKEGIPEGHHVAYKDNDRMNSSLSNLELCVGSWRKSELRRTKAMRQFYQDIFHRYLDGETYAGIGRSYGLTKERIRQLINMIVDDPTYVEETEEQKVTDDQT